MNIPQNLLYSKEHEWVRIEGDKAYIGISDYAQHHLGDIVFVELPEPGTEFDAMTEAVFCPVTGKVVEINEQLLDSPEMLNKDPYTNFLFAVETDGAGKENLLPAADYAPLCEEE